MLQKTLHMSLPLEECRTRLANIQGYRRQFVMVTKATVTSSKTIDFSFRGPLGFEGKTGGWRFPSGSPYQLACEVWGGNIDLRGCVDLTGGGPDCTEVTIAVHYEIQNKLSAWLDRKFGFIDSFLTAELRSLRSHFEGVAAPVASREPAFAMFEPLRA